MFNRNPHKEQRMCERMLNRVMKRLKINYFNFNWDRNSCFIEFNYEEDSYRLEHSIEKAKKRGVILKNGLDCLIDLTQSLEDLCSIIERGTYNFETWIAGMKTPAPLDKKAPVEEAHLNYQPLEEQSIPVFTRNEQLIAFAAGSSRKNFEHNQINQNQLRQLRNKKNPKV